VVQLVPAVPSGAGSWTDRLLGAWSTIAPAGDRREVQAILPGWHVYTTAKDAVLGKPSEGPGGLPILTTQAKRQEEFRLARSWSVPANGRPHLRMVVGHQPGESWRLVVRVNEHRVFDELVGAGTAANGWRDVSVPLANWSGQSPLVQVVQFAGDSKTATGLWQRLDLVSQ
jgi:hypothetical protein